MHLFSKSLFHRKKKKPRFFGLCDRDIVHHGVLATVVLIGFYAIQKIPHAPVTQFAIGVIVAVLYVLWGVFHHYHDNDLHAKNMIEYILFALLGIIILAMVFL